MWSSEAMTKQPFPSSVPRFDSVGVFGSLLRTATGRFVMASEDHVHHEAKVLPVKAHAKLLSTQYLYLASAGNPSHPCHFVHNLAPPPRPNIKRAGTLKTRFGTYLQPHLLITTTGDRKRALADLHRTFVQRTARKLDPNPV